MSQSIGTRRIAAVNSAGTTIQSLDRALTLLEAVARESAGAAMADLSRAAGLHTSTAFHLLQTLVGRGYLVQDPQTRRYRVGPRLLRVAASATSERYISDAAAEILTELTAQTSESSSIAVLERDSAVILTKVEGLSRVGLIERPGEGRPLHCTAIGKVLLAALPQAKAQILIAEMRLDAFTPRTITRRGKLLRELSLVRSQGYAIDDEEFGQGLRCVAAPVRSFSRQVVGALGVAGPIWSIPPERIPALVEATMAAADRLSTQLGYPGLGEAKQGGSR
jgi:DNA-binding IclR family transcriptional regulator